MNSVFVDHHLKTDRHQSSKYNSCIYTYVRAYGRTYVRTYATVLKLADANGDIFGREKREKSSSFLRSVCRLACVPVDFIAVVIILNADAQAFVVITEVRQGSCEHTGRWTPRGIDH